MPHNPKSPQNQDTPKGENFSLEPTHPKNLPNAAVIANLLSLKANLAEASHEFNDGVKAVSEKHKLRKAALKRYLKAIDSDGIEDAKAEVDDVERLIDAGQA